MVSAAGCAGYSGLQDASSHGYSFWRPADHLDTTMCTVIYAICGLFTLTCGCCLRSIAGCCVILHARLLHACKCQPKLLRQAAGVIDHKTFNMYKGTRWRVLQFTCSVAAVACSGCCVVLACTGYCCMPAVRCTAAGMLDTSTSDKTRMTMRMTTGRLL
jgi:hypothetical protein